MNIEALHINQKVRHPQYGVGIVKAIGEQTAEVRFDDGVHTLNPGMAGLEPAEPQVAVSGLGEPLGQFVAEIVRAVVRELGLEQPDLLVESLGARWHGGRLVLHPGDTSLQAKEVPLEIFFHKIVMMRNNLRVLEQKINAHDKLTDGDKVELQQYISRCYGSMTTFNTLFRQREDYFSGKE